jgi:hypothetical protein
MSRRIRKRVLLPLTLLAVAAGTVAGIAQTVSPVNPAPPAAESREALGPPTVLAPPEGDLPSWLTAPPPPDAAAAPPTDTEPPAASAAAEPGIPPAHADEAAPAASVATSADPAAAETARAERTPAVTERAAPAMPDPAPAPGATMEPGPALSFGPVNDPDFRRKLEKWQRDQLLYSFALKATQAKEQLCALEQAPEGICKRPRPAVAAPESPPVQEAPRQYVAPAPVPEKAPPYRVLSVAGSGTDLVVTLFNEDVSRAQAVRPGAWIDSDFKLVSADYKVAVIKSNRRTWRLPVAAGAEWGKGS